MTDWVVTPLAAALGVRVDGVDLAAATDADLDRLAALLAQHHVVAVSGRGHLGVDTHVRVATRFGEPLIHPFLEAAPEHGAVLDVRKEPGDTETFGGAFWHCDISFMAPPASVSVLHGIEIPPTGGDTLFANQVLALAALSRPVRTLLNRLTATHVYPDMAEGPSTSAVHPVARRHPVTGEPSLYVNPAFVDRINELERAESAALLSFLYDHQVKPEFQLRLSWTPHQVVLWDNRTTLHYAMNDYPGQRRHLQRVTAMERR